MPASEPATTPSSDWKRFYAFGWPAGSVRALMALIVFGTIWALLALRPDREVRSTGSALGARGLPLCFVFPLTEIMAMHKTVGNGGAKAPGGTEGREPRVREPRVRLRIWYARACIPNTKSVPGLPTLAFRGEPTRADRESASNAQSETTGPLRLLRDHRQLLQPPGIPGGSAENVAALAVPAPPGQPHVLASVLTSGETVRAPASPRGPRSGERRSEVR